ncbi:MAG: UvrD-helicase domain-containing protein [Akkermansiaceae bacterium]|nr:UvrD-helicase domain-containing protein [Akkermansiaceae bacterium]
MLLQDNDRAQYDFVSALHRVNEGSVFLVGDLDQAIYQFRGADVSLPSIRKCIPHRPPSIPACMCSP